jgi:hypothetical protein
MSGSSEARATFFLEHSSLWLIAPFIFMRELIAPLSKGNHESMILAKHSQRTTSPSADMVDLMGLDSHSNTYHGIIVQ